MSLSTEISSAAYVGHGSSHLSFTQKLYRCLLSLRLYISDFTLLILWHSFPISFSSLTKYHYSFLLERCLVFQGRDSQMQDSLIGTPTSISLEASHEMHIKNVYLLFLLWVVPQEAWNKICFSQSQEDMGWSLCESTAVMPSALTMACFKDRGW